MDFAATFMQSADTDTDVARKALKTKELITGLQESFNVIEKCPQPVICAIHSGCIGGGVDLVSACDIRLCSSDAWFQIKVCCFHGYLLVIEFLFERYGLSDVEPRGKSLLKTL